MAKINWSSISGEKKERTPKDTSNIFKLTKDEHLLRIVPFPLKSKNFDSTYFNEDNNVFCELYIHKSGKDDLVPYRDDKATFSLDTFEKNSDPISTFGRKLWYDNNKEATKQQVANMEIAKRLLPERPTYVCVIDRDDETATPKLWKIPKFNESYKLFERAETRLKKALKMDADDDIDWTDVNTGYDITVESIEKPYGKGSFRDITSVLCDTNPSPVAETKSELSELYSVMPTPFDLCHILSATELEEILQKSMDGDEPDEDDTIKAKPKSNPVAKKQLIVEDEDEDADEPVTKPVSKKKQIVEDEEDEDDAPVTKSVSKEKDFNAMFKGKDKKKLVEDDEEN
jgi:hypothetical protein